MLKVLILFLTRIAYILPILLDDHLVIRHRRPMLLPYPSPRSHPLPTFSFTPKSGQITVTFSVDPRFYSTDPQNPAFSSVHSLPGDEYILAAQPRRRPPGLVDRAGSLFSSAKTSLAGARAKSNPEEVFDGQIDLREGEVVDGDKDEAFEVDDDPDPMREVKVVCANKSPVGKQTAYRRRWEIVPLRESKARTGAI